MKILIPMAGSGQRFADAGYEKPKPLIDVLGKPMIQCVVENLGGPSAGEYVYVVQQEHCKKYKLDAYLQTLTPNCSIWYVHEPTAGAACTALVARADIDTPEPLLIANCDQLVEYARAFDPQPFQKSRDYCANGVIYTFGSRNPKWSYVAVDDHGQVWGVAEKQVISERATCGIYWWKHGADFVRSAEQMISRNIRVNNEFYIAPAFNEFIRTALFPDVVEENVQRMWGLGTPEDLRAYEDAHRP